MPQNNKFRNLFGRIASAFGLKNNGAEVKYNWEPFSQNNKKKVLIISVAGNIPQSQIFPFLYFSDDWREPIQWRHIDLEAYEADPESAPDGADIVIFQTWINKSETALIELISIIRTTNRSAKIIYLDFFAPTDLRYANTLETHIDLYIKKHVLRDRKNYLLPVIGETNLTDHYAPRYGFDLPTTFHEVSDSFLRKLVVGPSFFLAPYLIERFHDNQKPQAIFSREFDLHARLGGAGTSNWYERMRSDAVESVHRLTATNTTPTELTDKRRYMYELENSKACFSPFGYGEVCWRDYEAVWAGSVLIKPDMNHIETMPDIFQANNTYIPISWSFEDLPNALHWIKANEAAAQNIASNAFNVLASYVRENKFIDEMTPILDIN